MIFFSHHLLTQSVLPISLSYYFCGIFSAVYLMTGAADDGGEDGPGGIVSGEASLHQTGAVVAHKGGSLVVVTHGGFCKRGGEEEEFSSPPSHRDTFCTLYMYFQAKTFGSCKVRLGVLTVNTKKAKIIVIVCVLEHSQTYALH